MTRPGGSSLAMEFDVSAATLSLYTFGWGRTKSNGEGTHMETREEGESTYSRDSHHHMAD